MDHTSPPSDHYLTTFDPTRSIMPLEDPAGGVPKAERDVAILEEPEHLNWFHRCLTRLFDRSIDRSLAAVWPLLDC